MLTKLVVFIIVLLVGAALFVLFSNHPYRAINVQKSDNYYFNLLKTEVRYVPMGNWFELGDKELQDLDVKTVEVLGRSYVRDKSLVYFESMKVSHADAASFEMLCGADHVFARDKNMVYFRGRSFQDLDITSFAFVGGTFVGGKCSAILRDNKRVYSILASNSDEDAASPFQPRKGANPETYQLINESYGKDDVVAYFNGSPIADSEAKTFQLLGEYARDARRIYYQGLVVNEIDPSTFALIEGGGYSRDQHHIYFGLNVIYDEQSRPVSYVGDADPQSFVMIPGEKVDYARDNTRFYWGGIPQ